MFSEDFKMSDRCPVCLEGELKFIHINLEEDVKMCMNEQCVYPFEIGVVDEFVPSRGKTDKGARNYESIAALMSKLEKEYQKDCLEWDKFADGNEFLSDMDQKAACEFVDKLDELSVKKELVNADEGFLKVQKFLDSLDDTSKTAPPTVCEDPVISKLIQSHIDTGEADVSRDCAEEDYIKSVISELEETQEKVNENSETHMQWDADDFNAETLGVNETSAEFSHSEACGTSEQSGIDKVADHSYHCVTAKESKIHNQLSMDCASSEETHDDDGDDISIGAASDHSSIVSGISLTAHCADITTKQSESSASKEAAESIPPLSDHTYCISKAATNGEISKRNSVSIDNVNMALVEEDGDLIVGKYEDVPSLSEHHSSAPAVAVGNETINNINSGQGIGDMTQKDKDVSVLPDCQNDSVPKITSTSAFQTAKVINNLNLIDPYGKTIIVRCTENIPLRHHFGSRYLKSIYVIQAPKSKEGNQASIGSPVIYVFPSTTATATNRGGPSEPHKTTTAHQPSAEVINVSEKPDEYGSSLVPNREESSGVKSVAAGEQTSAQFSSESDTSIQTSANMCTSSSPPRIEWQSCLDTAGRTEQLSSDSKKQTTSMCYSSLTLAGESGALEPDPDVAPFSEAFIDESCDQKTTALVEETCTQTNCASEESKDSVTGYIDQFNQLFGKNKSSFAKFDFPELDKTGHKIPQKDTPQMCTQKNKTVGSNVKKKMPSCSERRSI